VRRETGNAIPGAVDSLVHAGRFGLGTRTSAYVALHVALHQLHQQGILAAVPLTDSVAAVSLGLFHGVPYLDLNYAEDATAAADVNIVMTGRGLLVEIQGTAERQPFSPEALGATVTLARQGIAQLSAAQRLALGLA
jgi:ribonuclease PH